MRRGGKDGDEAALHLRHAATPATGGQMLERDVAWGRMVLLMDRRVSRKRRAASLVLI